MAMYNHCLLRISSRAAIKDCKWLITSLSRIFDVSREESMLWVMLERYLLFKRYHFSKSFFSCSKCFLFKSWMLSMSFFRVLSSAAIGLDCYFRFKISFYKLYCYGFYFYFPYTKEATAFSLLIFYNLSFLYCIFALISFITFPISFPLDIFYPKSATFFYMA